MSDELPVNDPPTDIDERPEWTEPSITSHAAEELTQTGLVGLTDGNPGNDCS